MEQALVLSCQCSLKGVFDLCLTLTWYYLTFVVCLSSFILEDTVVAELEQLKVHCQLTDIQTHTRTEVKYFNPRPRTERRGLIKHKINTHCLNFALIK